MARQARQKCSRDATLECAAADEAVRFFGAAPDRHEACLQLAEKLYFECEARRNGFLRIAGVDEAGRGPLAGPIVAGAVVLASPVPGVDDSKRLGAESRRQLFGQLHDEGHAIGVGVVTHSEIDQRGIQWANYMAMIRALEALKTAPDFALVDGFTIPACPVPHIRLIKGDVRSHSIAAASIIAKVTRDRLMDEYDRAYPGYGFARHKGYATAAHLAAIARLGPCPIHRMSFSPFARPAETAPLFEVRDLAKDASI